MQVKRSQFINGLLVTLLLSSFLFSGVFISLAAGGDFSSNFTNVVIRKSNGDPLPAIVPKDTSASIGFDYMVPAGGLTVGDTYEFKIPQAVATNSLSTFNLTTTGGSDGIVLAEITVNTTTGDCTITFNQTAADEELLGAGATGSFWLNTTLDKDKIPNGTKELVFFQGSPGEKTVAVAFAVDQITASGTNSITPTLNMANNKISWQVEAVPALQNANIGLSGENTITNLVITSKVAPGLELTGTPTLKLNDSPINSSDVTFTRTGDIITGYTLAYALKDTYAYNYASNDKFTIDYDTTYDIGAFQTGDTKAFTNKVGTTFTYPQYQQDSGNGAITLSATAANKTITETDGRANVAANFLAKSSVHDGTNQKITWTLTVNGDNVGFTNNFDVTDKIPEGLKLIGSSVQIQYDGSGAITPSYIYD